MVDRDIILAVASEVAAIVSEKNKLYGSAFELSGEVLKILYPSGVSPEQYTDMLSIVRVVDKLFRIANRKANNGDSESPWLDITGYGLLNSAREVANQEGDEE